MTEEQIEKQLEEFQLVYLDDVPLDDPKPAPPYGFAKYEQDLDSGRDLTGTMQRNVLAHHPRKLFLKFPYGMNGEQMKKLLSLVDKQTINARAFDPWTNSMQTRTMKLMHGDLVPEVDYFEWNYDLNSIQPVYNEFSVELVEY